MTNDDNHKRLSRRMGTDDFTISQNENKEKNFFVDRQREKTNKAIRTTKV